MAYSKEKFNSIEKIFFKDIRRLGIHTVIATVSGGADSIALVSALAATGINVIAAHCNFHLRGEESMRDQHHVEDICRKLNVKLLVKDFDIADYIKTHKGESIEMACRKVRYEWFDNIAKEFSAVRIATGHNADDNIETLFLNLMRGSGTTGLRGMLPDNGKIWRPLLSFHRREIESYLKEKRIDFITDSSNLSNDYRRNFLRNRIIPLLRSRWEGFDKALDRSLSILRNENHVVNSMVDSNLPDNGTPLTADTIMSFPAPELLVRRYIEPLKPFTTTAGEVIEAIIADKPDKRQWNLRNGILTLQNRKLHISPNK